MKTSENNEFETIKSSLIEKHGKDNLRVLVLPKDDQGIDNMEVIVKVPSRDTMSQFMRFIEVQPKKAQELLVNQCLLTSKELVNSDDGLFFACVTGLSELFPIRQAIVKKL